MKTKDLVVIGAVAFLGFLFLRKKPLINSKQNQLPNGGTSSTDNIPNGGLNLGQNMDLPNLTPKPKDGLSTEEALNNSNVKPINKEDNEPTQIFFNELPAELKPKGISTIIPKPIDVIPTLIYPKNYEDERERIRLLEAEMERLRRESQYAPVPAPLILEAPISYRIDNQIDSRFPDEPRGSNYITDNVIDYLSSVKPNGTSNVVINPIDVVTPTPVESRGNNYITDDVIDYLSDRKSNGYE